MKKQFSALFLLIIILLSTLLTGCFGSTPVGNISLDDIPAYSGSAYIAINENVPFFTEDEIKVKALEEYAYLDALGRCGVAIACIGRETMPTEDREEIGSVTPSGWKYNKVSNNNTYDFVDGSYIYNRCHLIGFQLAGENANEKNLITGTRYLNIEGMLPFEKQIADYVKATGNHVLFRVTPIFENENLVCSGVLMEAVSIEDGGEGVQFCVYAYNVQPGVTINYFTGQNVASGEELPPVEDTPEATYGYIINTKSKTVHVSSCSNASKIAEENRMEFEGDTETLLEEFKGYSACGNCLPNLEIPEATPDTPTSPEQNPDEGDTNLPTNEVFYILNTKSKKYHLPTCKNLPSEENRAEYTGDLATFLEEYGDYIACGSCKP